MVAQSVKPRSCSNGGIQKGNVFGNFCCTLPYYET
jgi:cytochrome P450